MADNNSISDIKIEEFTVVMEVPEELSIMPVEQFVLFPSMIAPIVVGDEKSKKLVDDALSGKRTIGVFTKRPEKDSVNEFKSLYNTGTAANILKMLKMPDGTLRLLLHGIQRISIKEKLSSDPFLKAKVKILPPEKLKKSKEVDALVKSILELISKAIEHGSMSEDLRVAAMNIHEPGRLADLVAGNLNLKVPEQQEILETSNVLNRLNHIHFILTREIEMMDLGSKIQSRVKDELDKNQREYFLREQMRAIRKELGEEEGVQELDEFGKRLETKKMPEYAKEIARKELSRLRAMQPTSSEYTVSRTYLETILDLPWEDSTSDELDISKAQQILDSDHYSLEKAKDRILEYLSVRKLKKDMKGPILCFVGPPGVGKTSLGRSIATAIGRKFIRFSLGGMRDEAEIRGHRRTYIGAMPGRLIKSIKQAGVNNPVILLDEIDKIGGDYRGDPASALLEVLDPEQNNTFTDHYLDMPFDLSKVMFITTANQLDTIPGPLLDRMEIIGVSGYTLKEKLEIAKRYTIPKQIKENGLSRKNISFSDSAIVRCIEDYTSEAGLRNLEQKVGTICRKVARMIAEGKTKSFKVTPETIRELLGPQRFFKDAAERFGAPGVSIGLAWTPVGGEILFIEATLTMGSGRFVITGQLGDVMRESAQAAMTYIHTNAEKYSIPEELFSNRDVHLHVPAGAIPKDGPSAGTAIATALVSLLSGRNVKDFVAMTGEITLRGNVLPVGGIKEKVLAAARAGIKIVFLPEKNRTDAEQLPDEIKKKLRIHFVNHVDEVFAIALSSKKSKNASSLINSVATAKATLNSAD